MNWGDGVEIVTLWLAIGLLMQRNKTNQEHLLRKVEKAEQMKTMVGRSRQAQMKMAEGLRCWTLFFLHLMEEHRDREFLL